MEAYQQRVVDEMKDLDDKIDKLNTFIGTETFANLAEEDALLLRRQLEAMETYSGILSLRIARFS